MTDDPIDDDPLYVLTAALLTPARFPAVLGDDYPEACRALGLEPYQDGYGLILGQDTDGGRWTVAVDDVSLVAVAIASWDCGMAYDLSPPERTVVRALPGWPLALAVAAPGVPAPHDPEPGEQGEGMTERLPLTPPDAGTWGPAQRRLGADEVAAHWSVWREQYEAETAAGSDEAREAQEPAAAAAAPGTSGTEGSEPAEPAGPPESVDGTDEADSTDGADARDRHRGTHEADRPANAPGGAREAKGPPRGVRRALEELRAYVDTAPPVGRVRSSFAPGEARTLRADGPGWSFVARTDDMAFVLLDEEPNDVLPVARGPELPALLADLDAMAVRPA